MFFSLVLGFCLTILLGSFVWSLRAKRISSLPTPSWTPFFGNSFIIYKNLDRIYDFLAEFAIKTPGPFNISLVGGNDPTIALGNGPRAEKNFMHVMKDNFSNYRLPVDRISMLADFFGSGIFAVDGDEWKMHRKAASHVFTMRNLRDHMSEVFVRQGRVVQDLLDQACTTKSTVDIQRLMFRYTMDSFSEVAFGEGTNSLRQDTVPFADSFDRVQYLMLNRIFDPLWRIKKVTGIGQREKEISQHLHFLRDYIARYTKRQIEAHARGEREGQDLISHYIRYNQAQSTSLTDSELHDIAMNFFIAGRDTTACALTWFFYELDRNPEVERRVVEEINQVAENICLGKNVQASPQTGDYGDEDNDQDINVERAREGFQFARLLTYTEAALLESLRLHPPVPGDDRQAINDDVLPDGTKVPARTNIAFNPYTMNRSQTIWGPDAAEFKPERWLNEDGSSRNVSQYAFPTFSAGPRVCLGRQLAILEAKTIISLIIPKFKIRVVNPDAVTYKISIILIVQDGLLCNIERRL